MEEYIVSARKYRPMTFDSVVGQSALTTTLKNAVKSGKLAHAYLFCGPRGVGKTTCARIFAKAINCLNPTTDGEACNNCESCQAFNENRSYNIIELDAASNNSVENIKSLMEQTRIPPQIGKYKVFIIDEVHMLSTAAFNAFLKTLEEPPAHVIFILATTEKHKILPTIISRCQIYDFERMTVEGIINHLKTVAAKENIQADDEALAVIAEKADGGMRDALSIFDQAASFCQGHITYEKVIEDLNVLDSDNYFKIIDLSLENKVSDIMVLLDNIISKGFDPGHLITGLASHVRNVLMAKDSQTLPLLEVSERQKQRYAEQAKKCPTPFLYKALRVMNQCDIAYRQSSNKRLLAELTLIEVAQITQPDDEKPSAGRRPKRLKSLFRKLVSAQSDAAKQVAAVAKSVIRPAEKAAATMPNVANEAPKAPSRKPIASFSGAKLILNDGMTFKQMLNKQEEKAPEEDLKIQNSDEEKRFSQDDVERCWVAMCNRMPQNMAALAIRMKNMKPQIKEYPRVELTVDNDILMEQINGIVKRIRLTMANDLHNGHIDFQLRLAEQSEFVAPKTRVEIFNDMRNRNSAIEKLRKEFSLELI